MTTRELIDLLKDCRLQFRRGETAMHEVAQKDGRKTNDRIDAAIKEFSQLERKDGE